MFARKYLAKNSCNLSLLYNSWNKFGKGFRETAKANPIPSPPPSITDATKFQQERQRVEKGGGRVFSVKLFESGRVKRDA